MDSSGKKLYIVPQRLDPSANLDPHVVRGKYMDTKIKISWIKYIPFLIIPLFAITWGIFKYQSINNIPVDHLQIKTNLPPMGQRVLPEQRRAFVIKFPKNAKTDFNSAIFTTTGDFHTIFSIQANWIDSKMVYSTISREETFSDLREMGFKHVIMSNGKEAWDIDLRN